MSSTRLYLVVLAALLVAIGACAPKPAPAPAPSPVAAPTPSLSPEDIAWAKVVAEAQKEGKVTLYTFQFTGDVGTSMARAFEDSYGIKLEFITGVGTVFIERIKTEQRAQKFIADTFDSAPSLLAIAKQDSLTASIRDIPVLREKDVWTIGSPQADPEGHIIGIGVGYNPGWINTALVKPGEEPKSWRELLEARWRGGKVTLGSPVSSPSPIYMYLATRKAGTLDDDFWRRLSQQELKVGPSAREPAQWLARGEAWITLETSHVVMGPYIARGAPIKAIETTEGVPINPYAPSIGLVRNGPHINAARVFVNWLLTREGQLLYSQAMGGIYPRRKDTPDTRPLAVRVKMEKPLLLELSSLVEAARVQREGTLAKLLGLEVK